MIASSRVAAVPFVTPFGAGQIEVIDQAHRNSGGSKREPSSRMRPTLPSAHVVVLVLPLAGGAEDAATFGNEHAQGLFSRAGRMDGRLSVTTMRSIVFQFGPLSTMF
jgi:hypothetical protein